MEIKEVITLTIRDTGFNGEGIGSYRDFTVFVPYALVGEELKVAVDRIKGKLVWAHIVKMLTPSPIRVTPRCPLFGKCGGCDLQHLSIDDQREIKRRNIEVVFAKAGIRLEVPKVIGGKPFFYRNKVALPFGIVDGKTVLGFYKEGTHKVVPLPTVYSNTSICPLHDAWLNSLVKITLDFVNSQGLSVYNERTGNGLLRHLVARKIGDNLSVVLVLNGTKLPCYDKLVAELSKVFGSISLHISVNKRNTNVIFGDSLITLAGKAAFPYATAGITAMVSPLSFLQVNTEIADTIYNRILQEISDNSTVIDAYSGTGVLTTLIATKARSVIGIEIIPDAVKNADENARLNGVSHKVKNYCGDAAILLPTIISKLNSSDLSDNNATTGNNSITADNDTGDILSISNQFSKSEKIVILDPPRQGVATEALNAVLAAQPDKIIYLSCNPATLARDIAYLTSAHTSQAASLSQANPAIIDTTISSAISSAKVSSIPTTNLTTPKSANEQTDDLPLSVSTTSVTQSNPITYTISTLSPYDMFPNCHHVETLVSLIKKS